jgi:hypothetical protein
MRTLASYLFCLAIVTVVLTFVQPMDPEVDKMFRIGAGIVMIVCLGILLGSSALEQDARKQPPLSESAMQPIQKPLSETAPVSATESEPRLLEVNDAQLNLENCSHCSTKGILPMPGNICPNCKKQLK